MKNMFLLSFTFLTICLKAQDPVFKVELSHDSLLLGNYVELKYTLENIQGKFTPPDFPGMKLIAGPNHASSYSFINGEVKQTSSYVYFLMPEAEGNYIIGEATVQSGQQIFTTPEINLVVMPNPDRLIQNPNSDLKNADPGVIIKPKNNSAGKKKTYRI
ncbi:MAG: BatD family protein [Saprospiraceae bacterium]|nr:BatD family protein [Saprospiraceae bacterium]